LRTRSEGLRTRSEALLTRCEVFLLRRDALLSQGERSLSRRESSLAHGGESRVGQDVLNRRRKWRLARENTLLARKKSPRCVADSSLSRHERSPLGSGCLLADPEASRIGRD